MIYGGKGMKETKWHQLGEKAIFEELNSSYEGLAEEEIESRQKEYGLNEITEKKGKTVWRILIEQFADPLVIILIIAAIISGVLGQISDMVVIMIVVALDAILGTMQENKAEKSLEALKKLASPGAVVKRGGNTYEVPAKDLVPGDIIFLEAGRYIPADCRILEESNLKVEESSLTGESVPVDKTSEAILDEKIPLGDKKNMVFMSSMVTYGRATAIVTDTGMNTEIGTIAKMIQEDDHTLTPLQAKLADLGKWLGIISVIICAAMFLVGILNGKDYLEMFMTAVSLAVAAIPEGLPTVVTIVLAIGVQRMAKKNAIIRKLPAVET